MRTRVRGVVWLVLAGVLVLAVSAMAAGGALDLVGGKAPAFTADDVNGAKVSLEELLKEKRLVVVNFWGLRCSACLEEMPHLTGIAREFGTKGVQVVGVNADGAPAPMLKRLMDKSEIRPEYLVVADPEMVIADAYHLTGAPLTVVVDARGTVRYRHENYAAGDENEFRAKILELLAEK